MKIFTYSKLLLLVCLLNVHIVQAQAPSESIRYQVTSAVSDPAYHNASHNHSVWVPGFFNDGAAEMQFTEAYADRYYDGRLHLHGSATVSKGSHIGEEWLVDVWMQADDTGWPKKELKSGTQPASVTDTWNYYVITSGTISRNGEVSATLTQEPGTYWQMGLTASGKNAKFGASTWFRFTRPGIATNKKGDFNLDLDYLQDSSDECPANTTRLLASRFNANDHALTAPNFFEGNKAEWLFDENTYFDIYNNGYARLHGHGEVFNGPGHIGEIWRVDVWFTERPQGATPKSPKGGNDPSLWEYFDIDPTRANIVEILGNDFIVLLQV